MISVQDALNLLHKNLPPKDEIKLQLSQSLNHIISEDIFSPMNMPPFRQSSMDGYAVCLGSKLSYNIIGEIKAGDSFAKNLIPGQAVKIFTGAAVPDSADCVVPIEITSTQGSELFLQKPPEKGTNIRPIGQQIKKNDLAIKKGNNLNPAAIGFLAGLGITEVKVYKKPSVGILVTGNELINPGNEPEHGKVFESNSIMLQAALINSGFSNLNTYQVIDDYLETKNTISKALSENDILLISGGISVGDYDFVKIALEKLKVSTLFYKVNQKPGKPLFVGKSDNKIIFALPGNPAATLTCFYIYVLPVLQFLSGKEIKETTHEKELTEDLIVKNPRSQFLKAYFTQEHVSVLSHQDSSMLNTFAISNCLVYVPEGDYQLKKGTKVKLYPIQ